MSTEKFIIKLKSNYKQILNEQLLKVDKDQSIKANNDQSTKINDSQSIKTDNDNLMALSKEIDTCEELDELSDTKINLTHLKEKKLLIFDLEWDKYRTIYQISWLVVDRQEIVERHNYDIIGVKIGPTHFERKIRNKLHVSIAKLRFLQSINYCDVIIAHNLAGDLSVLIKNQYLKSDHLTNQLKMTLCTMKISRYLVQAKNQKNQIKAPKLIELYEYLFSKPIVNHYQLHQADVDCDILYQCVIKLIQF